MIYSFPVITCSSHEINSSLCFMKGTVSFFCVQYSFKNYLGCYLISHELLKLVFVIKKILFFPLILIDKFAGHSNHGWQLLLLCLKYIITCFSDFSVADNRSDVILMFLSLYIILCYSHSAFSVSHLHFLDIFTMMYHREIPLWSCLLGV